MQDSISLTCCVSSSHYPQTKATVVAETPELARLTQASKNQSQVRLYLIIYMM